MRVRPPRISDFAIVLMRTPLPGPTLLKVGTQSAQGKVMLLCLAQQLAKQLEGFAEELLPIVDDYGDGAQLTLVETFYW